MVSSLTITPVAVSAGGDAVVSVIGGDTSLSDGSDTTYVRVTAFTGSPFSPPPPKITFPGVSLPVGALSRFALHGRYELLAATPDTIAAYPQIAAPTSTVITSPSGLPIGVGTGTYAGLGDGIVEVTGPWSDLADWSELFNPYVVAPTTWRLDFPITQVGTVDFRLYELALNIEYRMPVAPPRLLYPRQTEGRRIYPPSITAQSGRRSGSGAPY